MHLTDYFTFSASYISLIFCLWHFGPISGHRLPFHRASRYHLDTLNSVGLLWMSDQPDAENSTRQHTTLTPTGIHALRGIRNPNCSKRTEADPSLRPPGHRNRPLNLYSFYMAICIIQ